MMFNKKIKFTTAQKIIEVLSAALVLFVIIFLLLSWESIPDTVPSHFDIQGNSDDYSEKSFLIYLFIAEAALYLLLTAVSLFPSIWNIPVKLTEENYLFVYQTSRDMLCLLKLVMVISFAYVFVCISQGRLPGGFYIPVFILSIIGISSFNIIKLFIGSRSTKK